MRKVLFLFGELDDSDIDWILARGSKVSVPAGATLVEEKKSIDALYLVLGGSFSVTATVTGAKEISRVMVGEIVGEISFVEKRLPSATVTALVDSLVFAIPRAEIAKKIEQDSGFAARFYRAVAVFLAYRLRNILWKMNPEKERLAVPEADFEAGDELDPHLLDNLFIAGKKFDRVLKQLTANYSP